MNLNKYKFEITAVVVSWVSFLVWEYYVDQWIQNIADPIVRVDLILILPALMILTLIMVFKMNEDK